MRCPYCGSEISDSSRFCPNCGAEQSNTEKETAGQTIPSQQEPSSSSSASGQSPSPQSKKKRFPVWLIPVAIGAFLLFRFIGSMAGKAMAGNLTSSSADATPKPSGSVSGAITLPSDVIVEYTVFWESESDGITTFEAVRYGHDTHIVKELVYIFRCAKSEGYIREDLERSSFRDLFPAFAEYEIYDDDGFWTCLVHLKDIDSAEKLSMMIDKELITSEEENSVLNGIDADYYIQSILDQGGRVASFSEISLLHLS